VIRGSGKLYVMKNNFFNLNNTAKAGRGTSSVSIEKLSKNDIAIIGMSGRLPLAEDMNAFWKNLEAGTDCIIDFPQQRIDEIRNYFKFKDADYDEKGFKFKRKGFLSAIDKFDYKFFKLTAKEAAIMNPAQRIFLQTAYHTIENAGYSVKKLKGSQTGIFLGYTGGSDDYLNLVKETEPEFAAMAYPANLASVIASRVAYVFDFKGPSLLIDTACSSSMVAFNMACQSLREGACDTALAGGINLSWAPLEEEEKGLGILSSSGKTKTFDEKSDGTVGGEGCIAILLKPLNKAIRDSDNILAVVKGIACNQDGTSIGITAPNALAQADVIEKAWADGKIDPETISYIEAHGTGTGLGDPIEIEGITQAFRKYTDKKQFCAIGAVKTNIGHLNSVAGIAGIAKAVLCLKNKKLPALLHFEMPNKKIAFEESPVYVNTRLSNWETTAGKARRCGISSFGMSGTNCHVILQEATASGAKKELNSKYLFAISAKSNAALTQLVNSYQLFLGNTGDDIDIENICFTATAGRDQHEHRIVFEVNDASDLKYKIGYIVSVGIENADNEVFTYNNITKTKEDVDDWHAFIGELTSRAAALFTDSNLYTYDYLLTETAKLYSLGVDIEWEKLYAGKTPARVELPAYPFEQKRCWVTYPKPQQNKKDHQDSNVNKPIQAMDNKANKNIGVNDQATSIGGERSDASQLNEIISMQLRIMSGQLEAVKNFLALQNNDENYKITPDGICVKDEVVSPMVKTEPPVIEKAPQKVIPTSYSPNATQADKAITAAQQAYVDELIRLFNIKTKTSKEFTQAKRQYYANNRHVAGYSKTYKEMMYPILVDEAHGSEIIDLDGNKYVDFCMGFGVYLLGYSNPVVLKGLEEQAKKGSYLGPMSPLPGEVAQLICELTGVERVAFYNSGTEAVMLALRLARAATSKTKIVMFSGSYHGTYDGVMGQADRFSKEFKAIPKSTGIPQSILDEVILLDYGTPESLEIIRKHAHELAGVLVEPVQSRRPEFQPAEYLLALRELTEELKVPLIFDEIITGFRIHPGGAQAWFGIKADLVTYGKIPGGGMPIGIIAGKAEFMHGVDGGMWQYGDDSHPKFDHRKTFVAGTFCHHPLTMASAKAALTHLKEQGPALQETLNRKTADMAAILNAYFEQENFEVKIVNFGSLFQIRTDYDLSLIVYHFLNSGIYAWEGMTFFISTAHSDQDIEFLISVFKNTLQKLRKEGFIQAKTIAITESGISLVLPENKIQTIALTEEQRRLWFIATADDNASVAFNSTRLFNVDEKVNETAFSAAVQKLADRHELLKAVSIDGDHIHIDRDFTYNVSFKSIDSEDTAEINALVLKEKKAAFNFSNGPFFRINVINYGGNKSLFVLVIHHIIADGWSVNVILQELTALYQAELHGTKLNLPTAVPFTGWKTITRPREVKQPGNIGQAG
jgi:glutamate-1-semialdehyde aminotransferase/3-oxoacyl-(acyl-carrier-protein) synthase